MYVLRTVPSLARRGLLSKLNSTAAASSVLAGRCVRPPPDNKSATLGISFLRTQARPFSNPADPPPASSAPTSPEAVEIDVALGVQDAVLMYIKHGLGGRRLDEIRNASGKIPLVTRWQHMMEAFLGTQLHVLAGLGYEPNERGMATFSQQLMILMQTLDPDTQEKLRIVGRDTWREVLQGAFGISAEDIEKNQLSIVDARNTMHKVSQKMMSPEIMEKLKEKCGAIESSPAEDGNMKPEEIQLRHTCVQEVLVNEVYLGGKPSLVSDCGFGNGERGYILMQCVMAEHQTDPLVQQYIGAAMMEVMKAAGLGPETLQQMQK